VVTIDLYFALVEKITVFDAGRVIVNKIMLMKIIWEMLLDIMLSKRVTL